MRILRYLEAEGLALGPTGSVAETGCNPNVTGSKAIPQITLPAFVILHPPGLHVLWVQ